MATTAATFYGTAYTPERAPDLEKATKYLDMALRAETESKQEMAFTAALRAEAAAFAK